MPARAEDSPHWRGLNRDGKCRETGLLRVWPEGGPKLLWTIKGLGDGFSSVAVAEGAIYTTGKDPATNHGVLSSFTLDGSVNWRVDYGDEWNDMQPGTRCCPTVDDGRVYVLSGLGRLVSTDAKTGKIFWNENIASRFGGAAPRCGFAESLLIDGGNLICTPGGKDASVVALDKITAKTVWTSRGLSEQSAYCSPILIERGGTRVIVTMTAQSVVGLEAATGVVLWQRPFDANETLQNHSITPVYEDGLLYITSGHGKGGTMFELSADAKSISTKWSDNELNCLHGGVVFLNGHVYGASSSHKWICLRASDGFLMYKDSGVGMGSIIYADGNFYCYGEKGTLGLVRAEPSAYHLVSSFKIVAGDGMHWAHPVISDGRLYIRHGDTLNVFDIKAD